MYWKEKRSTSQYEQRNRESPGKGESPKGARKKETKKKRKADQAKDSRKLVRQRKRLRSAKGQPQKDKLN